MKDMHQNKLDNHMHFIWIFDITNSSKVLRKGGGNKHQECMGEMSKSELIPLLMELAEGKSLETGKFDKGSSST